MQQHLGRPGVPRIAQGNSPQCQKARATGQVGRDTSRLNAEVLGWQRAGRCAQAAAAAIRVVVQCTAGSGGPPITQGQAHRGAGELTRMTIAPGAVLGQALGCLSRALRLPGARGAFGAELG